VDVNDRSLTLGRLGLAGRYAAALFDLAVAQKALGETAAALEALQARIADTPDLKVLVSEPRIRRDAAAGALRAVAAEMHAPSLVADFLGVVAMNGRTRQLPAIIDAFGIMVRSHQGVATADITVAQPLTESQQQALAAKLKARTGRQMDLAIRIDPAILGGVVVRIGSEQVDASIRTRLDRLGQQMKGL